MDQLNQPQSSGTAQFNLRNLGLGSTLILVDGQRWTNSAVVATDGSGFVDINSLVPMIALQRVEVVKDGASAVYGSDAVAGVVNFITRRGVDRPEISAKYAVADGSEESVIEALGGFGSSILIELEADGSVAVTDHGRGIPTGMNEQYGISTVELVLTHENVSSRRFSTARHENRDDDPDDTLIFDPVVRFIGQRVAAVVGREDLGDDHGADDAGAPDDDHLARFVAVVRVGLVRCGRLVGRR